MLSSAPHRCGPSLRPEIALALLVLGFRLWVFWYAGSPLPYYDEWIAEFHNTLLKIVHGEPLIRVLFTGHNEHLLVTTKLTLLLGFALNGYWDVEFLIVAAALARAIEAGVIYRLATSGRTGHLHLGTWLACAAVFATPVSGFNLLCGMQVSFCFADLALLASVFTVLQWSDGRRSGLLLLLIMLLGLCSMGSAIAIPVATAATHLVGQRRRPGFWIAWGLTLAAAVAYAFTIGHGSGSLYHDVTPLARLAFIVRLLSWPVMSLGAGVAMIAVIAALVASVSRNPELRSDTVAGIMGLGAFAMINVLLIGANRASGEFHPRHWESVALLPLSVALLGATLFRTARWRQPVLRLAMVIAAAVVLVAFAANVWRPSLSYLRSAREHRAEALRYHREILTSSKMVAEADGTSRMLDDRGQFFYDDPILRFSPHHGVYAAIMRAPMPALSLLSPDILPVRSPSTVSRATDALLAYGWIFAAAGPALLVGAAVRRHP